MRWLALMLLAVLQGAAPSSLQPIPEKPSARAKAKVAEAGAGVLRCTEATPLFVGRSLAQGAPQALLPLQE